MSIEIKSESYCDTKGCRNELGLGDKCHCDDCYQELLDAIKSMEEEIGSLTDQLRNAT